MAPAADKNEAARPKTAFGEFLLGLKTRSLLAWIGTLVFCAAELLACFLFFEPRRLVRLDPRLLMETPNDEYVELSMQLLRMRTRRLDELHVGYLGASQMARALIDQNHPDNLSRYLSERAGAPVEFDMLASAGQRFEDALAITDQFPPSFRGVLVMGVNDYKDDYRAKDQVRMRHHLDRILVIDAPSLLPFLKDQGLRAEAHWRLLLGPPRLLLGTADRGASALARRPVARRAPRQERARAQQRQEKSGRRRSRARASSRRDRRRSSPRAAR